MNKTAKRKKAQSSARAIYIVYSRFATGARRVFTADL